MAFVTRSINVSPIVLHNGDRTPLSASVAIGAGGLGVAGSGGSVSASVDDRERLRRALLDAEADLQVNKGEAL